MVSNQNELNSGSKNQFFANNDVPYYLKAGLASVLLHTSVNYYKNSAGQDSFMAMLFDKDTTKTGKENRVIKGSISFTFGVPSSIAEDNCQASMKNLSELYPAVGNVLDNISVGNVSQSDEEICNVLVDASAKRFILSQEGTIKNWDKYVSDNFDAFVKQVKTHYPGMVSIEVYENLKNEVENACKKKQIAQQRMA